MNPTESPRLTVIGTGYLGATHAICMAVLGFDVLGVDVDRRKVERLASGEVPFFEPGLPELLSKALESGRLRFTTSFEEAGEFGDVHFLCVGTPQQPGSDAADLTYVDAAVRALAPTLTRRALVVGKSTVPVGTARNLTDLIHELAPAGEEVELAWNPEFLREGFAVDDTMRPDRLVFGVESDWAEERLRAAFKPILEQQGTPVVRTDLATAELVKVAANSFLATKISYINAMAEVCEAVGADIKHLADSLALDDRIGGKFLKPGLGFGGGCLPKDIRAFAHRAEELGVGQAVSFLREVDDINRRRRARTVDLVREMLGGISGKRIAAWGAAFKPNSDDIRDAPALDVARTMHGLGGHVRVFDPAALDNARRAFPELRYGDSALDVAQDADVVVLLTEWSDFKEIEPDALAQVVRHKRIVDGRHALDAAKWRSAGWEYRALGRS
ncbi:UDP-glucose dehydrogenase family protein [Actinomadura sp. NTSP31]|uniref:UDP-glucose dehydrogenase family protein n=1 Tax=Actinomadura sp. NTSP31 TaxID=1735447 RepID=UPI0035BF78CD